MEVPSQSKTSTLSKKQTQRGDGCMIYEVDKDVDDACSKILDMDPGLDYDIH